MHRHRDDPLPHGRWHLLTAARVSVLVALVASGCAAPPTRSEPSAAPAFASEIPSPVTASVSAAASSDAQPRGPCPADMVDVGVACIDRYEAPNEKGAKPLRMQSVDDANAYCTAREKRLCDEDEWNRACEGPHHKPYPYGPKYEAGRCNDDGKLLLADWAKLGRYPGPVADAEATRLDQSEPSGTRDGCVSEEGVHDLTGNVAEWVVRTQKNPTNFTHVVKGCFWGRCFREPHEPACAYVNYAHPAGFRSYEMGFRCCAARSPTP